MTHSNDEHESERTITVRRFAAPPPPPVGHFLTFVEAGQQRRVPVPLEGLTIGRQAPSTLIIPSPEISRRHCRLDVDGEWVMVTDLNATNGTFVDHRRIDRPSRLRNDAVLSLGSFDIRYERRDPRAVAREEELTADLRRAEDYVRAILPPPLTDGPVLTDWWFEPSSQLGGDAFGYQFLDDRTFTGFLLDVSGHGIGSAMHAVNAANALRRRALPGVDFREPAQVAAGLNAMFPMEDHNDLMLTLWYFVYDLPSRTLRFCTGGHHASYLAIPGPGLTPLARRGSAIGMLPRGRWEEGTETIPPGARLFVFSDGAFEFIDTAGREWTIDDLRPIIAAAPAEQAAGHMWQTVRRAARPGPMDDDVSLLVVTFR